MGSMFRELGSLPKNTEQVNEKDLNSPCPSRNHLEEQATSGWGCRPGPVFILSISGMEVNLQMSLAVMTRLAALSK